ncbi:hypothetical protein [Streptomyces sp. IGB124]|uniref:hypothetical protein n=1 Tax=Streptomyces sp. IGB124 TaxID=1519485 RepID=UPI0006B06924|nr:hypothetical protein [Streptomyces sp. IGB124]KOU66710.1 hypothetical protein ADK96_12685 [Streptomyces sp. IGB124]
MGADGQDVGDGPHPGRVGDELPGGRGRQPVDECEDVRQWPGVGRGDQLPDDSRMIAGPPQFPEQLLDLLQGRQVRCVVPLPAGELLLQAQDPRAQLPSVLLGPVPLPERLGELRSQLLDQPQELVARLPGEVAGHGGLVDVDACGVRGLRHAQSVEQVRQRVAQRRDFGHGAQLDIAGTAPPTCDFGHRAPPSAVARWQRLRLSQRSEPRGRLRGSPS